MRTQRNWATKALIAALVSLAIVVVIGSSTATPPSVSAKSPNESASVPKEVPSPKQGTPRVVTQQEISIKVGKLKRMVTDQTRRIARSQEKMKKIDRLLKRAVDTKNRLKAVKNRARHDKKSLPPND